MRWIDAHNHLDLPAFDPDRDAVVGEAERAGVAASVLAGADPADWDRVAALGQSRGWPWVIGVHPWWCAELEDAGLDAALRSLAARATPWGIGETGLDRRRGGLALQERSLRAHLALARERGVPVVLHIVGAYPEALAVLREVGLPAGGMVHSWSGPPELVEADLALGLHLSFGASACRPGRAAKSAARVPADRLLLETDAPDQPLRARTRGVPADLVAIAERIGTLRSVSGAELLDASAANVRRLFGGACPIGPSV
jgi:TatD DNase family protein